MKNISIIGAGLVGSLLAIMLARKGYQVKVFERAEDPRPQGQAVSDRSLMIVLSARGLYALDAVGAGDKVRRASIPVYGRMVHDIGEPPHFHSYGHNNECLQAIDRGQLSELLVRFASGLENIKFYFRHKCEAVDLATAKVQLRNAEGQKVEDQPDILIGADGAYSAVRQHMQRAKYFDYSQRYLDQSYKEIVIPANTTLSPQLANDAFHVWPRGQFMLSGFPKIDGSFSLSLQLPRSGDITFDKLATLDDYRNFFSQHFPDALSFADPYLHSYVSKPEGSLLTVKCAPWSTGGRVGLIGDACHGILPFLGQGANAGFEDCLALLASLEDNQHNWQQAFVDYENRRRPNTDLIADWSYENFQTLQKHIADPAFALRKQLELRFVHLFPDMDSPSRYYNIAFTRKPYQEIQNIDRRYAELFTHILSTDGIEKKLMSDSADTLILRAAKAYGFTDSK